MMFYDGEYGPITQDGMGPAMNTGICSVLGSYLCGMFSNVSLLRDVKNLVIRTQAYGGTIYRTNFGQKTGWCVDCVVGYAFDA